MIEANSPSATHQSWAAVQAAGTCLFTNRRRIVFRIQRLIFMTFFLDCSIYKYETGFNLMNARAETVSDNTYFCSGSVWTRVIRGPQAQSVRAALIVASWRRPHELRWFLSTKWCWQRARSSPRTTTGKRWSPAGPDGSAGRFEPAVNRWKDANLAANGCVYIIQAVTFGVISVTKLWLNKTQHLLRLLSQRHTGVHRVCSGSDRLR